MGKLLNIMQRRNVTLGVGREQSLAYNDDARQKQVKDLFVQSFLKLPEETRTQLLNEYLPEAWKEELGRVRFTGSISSAKRQGGEAVRNFVTNDDSFGRPWQEMIPVMETELTPRWVEDDAYKGMAPDAPPEEKAVRLLTSKTLDGRTHKLWPEVSEERRSRYRQEMLTSLNTPQTLGLVLDGTPGFAPGKNWEQFVTAVETAMGEKAVEDAVNGILEPGEMPEEPGEVLQEPEAAPQYRERTFEPADLPQRRERRALIEQLRQLEEEGRNVPGYAEYLEKMVALDQQMEELSRLNSQGVAQPLDAESTSKLRSSIRETALAGEKYISNVRQANKEGKKLSLKKGAPGIVNQLQGMLALDEQTLSRYDPSMALSLPQVQESARTKTLILNNGQLKTMGGNQNNRIPLSIQKPDGKEYRGMFTKANYSHTGQLIRNIMTETEKSIKTEEGKAEFRTMKDKMRAYWKTKYPNAANIHDDKMFLYLIQEFTATGSGRGGYGGRKMFEWAKFCEEIGLDDDKIGADAMRTFGAHVTRLQYQNVNEMMNTLDLGIREGSRIDSRNSAMSAAADLLGVPNLLARSTNMRFMDGEGRIQEGTVMDFGKGLDLNDDLSLFKHVNDTPFSGGESYKALKDMADLQILDYICGNVDRHAGNLMYETDDEGRIIGIQGIDNDSSFGSFFLGKDNFNRLPSTANMNCISKSMCDRVMKMDPAMVRFMLRGRALTEAEMDYAVKRVQDVQDAIRKGKEHYKNHPPITDQTEHPFDKGFLRVVSDEEFKNLSLKKMIVEEGQKNLFSEVNDFMKSRLKHAREDGYDYDKKLKPEEKKLPEFRTQGQTYTGQGLLRSIDGARKLVRDGDFSIDDLTDSWHGTSDEFDNMTAAAKKLAELEQALADDIKERQEKGQLHYFAVEYERLRRPIAEAKKDLGEKTDVYLNKKMRERNAPDVDHIRGKNRYERERIAHALKLRNYTRDHEVSPAIPEDVLKATEGEGLEIRIANELSAEEEAAAAVRMLREIHEKNGLEAPETYKGMDGNVFNKRLGMIKKETEGPAVQPEPAGPKLN